MKVWLVDPQFPFFLDTVKPVPVEYGPALLAQIAKRYPTLTDNGKLLKLLPADEYFRSETFHKRRGLCLSIYLSVPARYYKP